MKFNGNSRLTRFEYAAKYVLEKAQNKPGAVLYDIGSKDAILNKYVGDKTDVRTYSFDLNPKNEGVLAWNIENPLPYEIPKANIICMLEVIEHLNNPWKSIKNCIDSLDKGGYILITSPNPHWSRSRLGFLSQGYIDCFTQTDLDENHHVFTAWPHIVEKLLTDCGCEIESYHTIEGRTRLLESPIKWYFPLQFVNRALRIMVESYDEKAAGICYAIIARKK